MGHFAFALVEGVGGDGLFGGRRLDRACHVFFDLFARQGAVVDADLVDQAVEEVFGEVGVRANAEGAFGELSALGGCAVYEFRAFVEAQGFAV